MQMLYYAFLLPNGLGPRNHVEDFLLQECKNDQLDSLILLTNLAPVHFPRLSDSRCQIVTPKSGNRILGILWFQFFAFRMMLTRKIRLRNPIFYLRYHSFIFLGLLVKLFLPSASIMMELNCIPNKALLEQYTSLKLYFRKVALFHFDRIIFRLSDFVTVVCPNYGANLVQNYNVRTSKLLVIPNGFHPEQLPDSSRQEARKRLGLEISTKYCIYVGALTQHEGVEFLIKAIKVYLQQKCVPNTKFLIVGDGDLLACMKSQVKREIEREQIVFTGNIARDRMFLYVLASDICLYTPPRVHYGFCTQRGGSALKLVDYLSCARSILIPRDPYYEYVARYHLGNLFEPDVVASFITQLSRMIDDQEFLETCEQNALHYAATKLTWDRTLAPLNDLLMKL